MVLAGLVLGVGGAFASCSQSAAPSGGAGGGTAGAGVAAGAGGSGVAGTGGGGVSSTGGMAGQGGLAAGAAGNGAGGAGAAGAAGAAGGGAGGGGAPSYAAPKWVAMDLGFPACTKLERLENGNAAPPAFSWGPCALGIDGCQQMTFSSTYPTVGTRVVGGPGAYDDGTNKWIMIDVGSADLTPPRHLFVANLDTGVIAQGFRMGTAATSCRPFSGAVGAGRLAIPFTDDNAPTPDMMDVAILVGKLDGSSWAVSPVTKISGGPIVSLANGRVGLNWAGGVVVTTIDWDTAQGSAVIAGKSAYGELTDLDGTPGGFVNGAITNPHWRLLQSDGLAKETQLLADPSADLMEPRYTGTHLVWVKGTNYQPDGSWAKTEIWASPYSWDPAGLAPQYVAVWPFGRTVGNSRAAFGRLMQTASIDGSDLHSVHVWTIPAGEHRRADIALTSNTTVGVTTGLTHEDVVFSTRPQKGFYDTAIVRIPIDKMPIVTP